MKRFSLPCVMTVIFYALLLPVHAEEAVFFSSPSKNIYCVYDPARAAQPPHLPRTEALIRCDIMQFTPTLSEVPTQTKDEIAALGKCTLRQMKAFVIAETATKSTTYCPTDMPGPEQFVLDYGKSYSKGGLTCLSEMKGMTCQNSLGHGFFLSRASQRLF